ncbi:MAG: helix-turn-helix domain-containing protein [Nitrospinales bacterium]
MNSAIQIIKNKNGKVEYFVVPKKDFERLVELAEDAKDLRAAKKFNPAKEETFPEEVADRLFDGENKLLVYREYRKLSRKELAERVGISESYISHLELGKRKGTADKLQKIAEALNIEVDLLI